MGNMCSGMVAVIFPGQGSQYAGMGKEFYETFPHAREIFRKANDMLGFDLTTLCFSGPSAELDLTENCQPAILTVSIACWTVLKDSLPCLNVQMLAGHSLGEFTSLVVAGSLSFGDALTLVRKRGRFMAESGKTNPGGMVACLGLEKSKAEQICKGILTIANFNCPGQIVVSGEKRALEDIIPLVKQAGGKAIPLSVSGAFHSPLMQTAAEKFASEVRKLRISVPRIPVIANVSADFINSTEAIKQSLSRQINNPVRWEDSIRRMIAEGINTFIEVGPGRVLSKLVARIDKSLKVSRVEDKKTLEETICCLNTKLPLLQERRRE